MTMTPRGAGALLVMAALPAITALPAASVVVPALCPAPPTAPVGGETIAAAFATASERLPAAESAVPGAGAPGAAPPAGAATGRSPASGSSGLRDWVLAVAVESAGSACGPDAVPVIPLLAPAVEETAPESAVLSPGVGEAAGVDTATATAAAAASGDALPSAGKGPPPPAAAAAAVWLLAGSLFFAGLPFTLTQCAGEIRRAAGVLGRIGRLGARLRGGGARGRGFGHRNHGCLEGDGY